MSQVLLESPHPLFPLVVILWQELSFGGDSFLPYEKLFGFTHLGTSVHGLAMSLDFLWRAKLCLPTPCGPQF